MAVTNISRLPGSTICRAVFNPGHTWMVIVGLDDRVPVRRGRRGLRTAIGSSPYPEENYRRIRQIVGRSLLCANRSQSRTCPVKGFDQAIVAHRQPVVDATLTIQRMAIEHRAKMVDP